jgi:ATP/ADP translocase
MTQSSTTIPRSALLLGLAGVLPFAWGVLTILLPDLQLWTAQNISPRMTGPYVQLAYGTVILAFMSGVLWGFATKTTGAQATSGYALSTLPALWAFFMIGGGPTSAGIYLIAGFLGLLALDFMFWRWGLAPPWWMHLRTLLTALVVSALAAGVLLA